MQCSRTIYTTHGFDNNTLKLDASCDWRPRITYRSCRLWSVNQYSERTVAVLGSEVKKVNVISRTEWKNEP